MKILQIISISFLLLPITIHGQIFEIKKGDKWGFIDKDGEIVVPPQYDYIYDDYTYSQQQEGFFVFNSNGKMGVYRSGYGELVPAIYDKIKVFSNRNQAGYFEITQNDRVGIMDTLGKVILEPSFDEIIQILPEIYTYRKEQKWGTWDQKDHFTIASEYDSIYSEIGQFIIARKEGFYSAWDRYGSQRYAQSPTPLTFLSPNVLIYQALDTSLVGLADSLGEKVTKPIFDSIKPLRADFFQIHQGRRRGLINVEGKIILDTLYSRISIDSTRRVWMIGERDLWGIMSEAGDTIAPPMFNRAGSFQNNIAKVLHRNGWAVINQFGDILTDSTYTTLQIIESTIRFRTNQGWRSFHVDKDGRRLLKKKLVIRKKVEETVQKKQQTINDSIFWASNPGNYGWYLDDNRYGWIDTLTRKRIKPIFSDVYVLPHIGVSIVAINSTQKKGRLFGMVDHKNGRIIRNPDLNMIYARDFFDHKVARAQYSTGAFVLINTRGKVKILQRTGYIGAFKNGLAIANTGNQYAPLAQEFGQIPTIIKARKGWGYLNMKGEWATKAEYKATRDYDRGLGIFKSKKKWGVYDSLINMIIPPQFDDIKLSIKEKDTLPSGVAPLLTTENYNRKYFFLDELGNLRFSMELEDAGDSHEGMIKVKSEGKWGFIDTLGNMRIEPKFERAGNFREGVARVRIGLRWGFIDAQGDYLIKPQYMGAGDFVDGIARVKHGARFGYINKGGSWVIKPVFYRAKDFYKGLAITRRKNNYGVINENGTNVIPHRFDRLVQEGDVFKVKKNGRFGFYDAQGQEISPLIYSHVGTFSEGRARVRIGREYKFIDENCRELSTPAFRWAKHYKHGLVPVRINGNWQVLDRAGNVVGEYQDYYDLEIISREKIRVYSSRNNWRLRELDSIPDAPNWVDPNPIPAYSEIFETVKGKFGYDDIHPPKEKMIVASCNQLYGLANNHGSILFHTKFEKISYRDGLYKVVIDGNISYLDLKGAWIYPKQKGDE